MYLTRFSILHHRLAMFTAHRIRVMTSYYGITWGKKHISVDRLNDFLNFWNTLDVFLIWHKVSTFKKKKTHHSLFVHCHTSCRRCSLSKFVVLMDNVSASKLNPCHYTSVDITCLCDNTLLFSFVTIFSTRESQISKSFNQSLLRYRTLFLNFLALFSLSWIIIIGFEIELTITCNGLEEVPWNQILRPWPSI